MKRYLLLFFFFGLLSGCSDDDPVPAPRLELDPQEDIIFEAEGGEKTVRVLTNLDEWTVTPSVEEPWFELVAEVAEKTFTVKASKYESATPREEIVLTVAAGDQSVKIKVMQQSPDFELVLSDPTETAVKFTVIPSDAKQMYYYDVLPVNTLNAYHEGDLKVFMANLLKEAVNKHGSVDAALKKIASTGEHTYNYKDLLADTEYVAFAIPLNDKGEVVKEPATKKFKTLVLPLSDMTFEVTFSNTTFDGADIQIVPSDQSEPYYFCIRPALGYKHLSRPQLLEQILMEDGMFLEFMSYPGTYDYANEHVCNTNTEYLLLCFGFKNGNPTTHMQIFPFRTSPADIDPKDCKFEVTVREITARKINVGISPSSQQVMYLFDLLDEESYNNNKADMKRFVKRYIDATVDDLDSGLERGDTGYHYTNNIHPESTYYVWSACIDEYGQVEGEVSVSSPIETPANVLSSVKSEASIEKYFNGDDLYKKDPEKYESSKGFAYVPIDFTHEGENLKSWYGTIVANDDPEFKVENVSDQELVKMLMREEYSYPSRLLRNCKWDVEYVMLSFAIDADGNNGKVFRKSVTFTKKGAAPVSEFVEP